MKKTFHHSRCLFGFSRIFFLFKFSYEAVEDFFQQFSVNFQIQLILRVLEQ